MCINKLNGVDEFDYEIKYTIECNGVMGCNANKSSSYVLKLIIYRITILIGIRPNINRLLIWLKTNAIVSTDRLCYYRASVRPAV